VFVGGLIVQALWNWLLPPLFGLPNITFWQGLGLLALARILFGGFGGRGSGHSSRRQRKHVTDRFADRVADRVAERMAERWDAMTPEDRELLREKLRTRWGLDSTAGEAKGQ
jgi:hypothetical protein